MTDGRARQLDAAQVSRVFRDLSREHIETKRRDDRDAIWAAIQARTQGDDASSARSRDRISVVPRSVGGPRSGRTVVPWVLAAAAVVALVVGVLARSESAPRYVVTHEDGTVLAVKADAPEGRLLATESLETSVAFADESKITLRPHTTLRLQVGDEGPVRVRLAQGNIRVHVEHHDQTDYRFHAGPYEVKVVGTTFTLAYEPETRRMNLDLVEGRVRVADGAGGWREVAAGTALELPERKKASDEPARTRVDAPTAKNDEEDFAAKTQPALKAKDRNAEDFRVLARTGRYEEIVRIAEHEGISRVLSSRSPNELQELAHAARYTGRTSLAIRVYEHLSLRQGGSSAGRRAPFFLGRLAEESGQLGRALTLYGDYLDRSPAGLYAAEALGRKMALVQRSRGAAAARPIAREYVRRFPDGSYHALARSLLGSARSRGE